MRAGRSGRPVKAVEPSRVLFIKLGRAGSWEENAIRKGVIRLGFGEANHRDCRSGRWANVRRHYVSRFKKRGNSNPEGTATRTVNEIRCFYQEPESTLWITFHGHRMWWCFAKAEVTLLPDKSKVRGVIGKWSDLDVEGNVLRTDTLSGRLLKIQRYQGTICRVREAGYLILRLNGRELKEVLEARGALRKLQSALLKLIQHLHWKDFETLVDLIFRQAGWQRVGQLGKTQKTLDLDLALPVTGERAIVQVKSTSTSREFDKCRSEFERLRGYRTLFYVVHSPHESLSRVPTKKNVRLILPSETARLAINAGLTDWIVSKSA